MVTKTIAQIKEMTFSDVIKEKVHVRIQESDVKNVTIHEDVVDLLYLFGMCSSKLKYENGSGIYYTDLEFMKDKITNFKTSTRYSYEKFASPSKDIWFTRTSQIKRMRTAFRYNKNSAEFLFVIDSLKTCSIFIEPNKEYFYPIYRVFKIFENRRTAEKKKKNNFASKKIEHQLMGIALASEIGLDEICKYEFVENTYETKNIERTFYYSITAKHNSQFPYITLNSNDKWETVFLNSNKFNSSIHLTKENLRKFLTTLKEIGEL